jgi:hypothetical protein
MFIPVLSAMVETQPSNEDMSIAFQIFKIVVLQLRHRDLALSDIVDALYNEGNEGLLRYTDPDRSNANQLVLASLGWISGLIFAESYLCSPLSWSVLILNIMNSMSIPSRDHTRAQKAPNPRAMVLRL